MKSRFYFAFFSLFKFGLLLVEIAPDIAFDVHALAANLSLGGTLSYFKIY